MTVDKCMYPNCECLDYCEAQDPHSKTPKSIKQIEDEVTKNLEKTEYYETDEWKIGRMP